MQGVAIVVASLGVKMVCTGKGTGMGLLAVGAYMRAIREARGLPRSEVAYKCETSESQVVRLEAGDLDTRFSLFFAICRLTGADLYDIDELLASETASEADGAALARKYLARSAETAERASSDPTEVVTLLRRLADLVARGAPLDVALTAVVSEQAATNPDATQLERQGRRQKRRQ